MTEEDPATEGPPPGDAAAAVRSIVMRFRVLLLVAGVVAQVVLALIAIRRARRRGEPIEHIDL